MTLEEILSGESEYLELKQAIPEKSETYMKTVVAFANGSGGRIVFGVEDGSFRVVGVDQEEAFSIMDGISISFNGSPIPSSGNDSMRCF